MLICWDKSTGPSWALMNSSEQDYRTPGASFARIPATRESFIGCISSQCELILNAGCCPLKQSCVSLLGRSRVGVFKPHKSSAVQWICPGKPHGERRRKHRITIQLSHVWSSSKHRLQENTGSIVCLWSHTNLWSKLLWNWGRHTFSLLKLLIYYAKIISVPLNLYCNQPYP